MLIKGIIHQQEIQTLNMCTPCIGAPNLIVRLLTVKKQASLSAIMSDFNRPLSPIDSIICLNYDQNLLKKEI